MLKIAGLHSQVTPRAPDEPRPERPESLPTVVKSGVHIRDPAFRLKVPEKI